MAATVITIRTDGFAPVGRQRSPRPVTGAMPFVMGGAALLLLTLAVPHSVTHGVRAQGDAQRQEMLLQNARSLDDKELDELIASREQPESQWVDTARAQTDLAQAYLIRAERAGLATPAGQEGIASALAAQQHALSLTPVDTFGWMRLAYLRLRTGAPMPGVVKALALSLDTGPHEPILAKSRMTMMALLRNQLSPETWEEWPAQARLAWRKEAAGTFLAARLAQVLPELRQALAESPGDVQRFDAMFAKLPKPAPDMHSQP
ncbi:MAG: hypothetical protein IPI58_06925 [Alphaproteobacteria bacterium]|nr:MAG: hypothetical protein IPI58_06925 [Alphaproteobacteria bacterium]